MNVNVNPSPSMTLFSIIQILTIILSIAKEVLMIFLLYKGIKVANVYINKNNKMEPKTIKAEENTIEDLDK
ncbi:hypothetical protein [Clostridium sp. Cult1]|uniref:hypothetical protein n=1 Tax=Clostridium sp. Cult1 TaxID=2079002 RepID=UPI001F1892DC|nr:hypothetical protein [Clostridium sp. Cult1]MCF6462578.1 hypothetical protein [Clostridium sp. Cult1]